MSFTIKTGDLATRTREVANAILNGVTVIVSRPKNNNWVLLSEIRYNELKKMAYLAKLDRGREDIKIGRTHVYESLDDLKNYVTERMDKWD